MLHEFDQVLVLEVAQLQLVQERILHHQIVVREAQLEQTLQLLVLLLLKELQLLLTLVALQAHHQQIVLVEGAHLVAQDLGVIQQKL